MEGYPYLGGKYLLSIDGTGAFSSSTIHCENCCIKNHRDETKTYYHQMLAGVIVHPDKKQVYLLLQSPFQTQMDRAKMIVSVMQPNDSLKIFAGNTLTFQ